jgi:hypothetical protein
MSQQLSLIFNFKSHFSQNLLFGVNSIFKLTYFQIFKLTIVTLSNCRIRLPSQAKITT